MEGKEDTVFVLGHTCCRCGKSFSTRARLMSHMVHHNNDRRYKCQHCSERFLKKSDLITHMNHHWQSSNLECIFCEETFSNKTALVVHMSLHSKTGKRYKCQYCRTIFFEKSELMMHMSNHMQTPNLTCGFCEQNFSSKTALIVHMSTHSKGNKNFRCSVCLNEITDELDSLALAAVNEYICSSCSEKGLSVSNKKRKSQNPFDPRFKEYGLEYNLQVPSDDDVTCIVNGNDDCKVEIDNLFESQWQHGDRSQSATSAVVSQCSTSDDHLNAEGEEIFGLDTEYNSLGAIDPLSNLAPTMCVYIKEENTQDSDDVDNCINTQKSFGVVIKKERDDDFQKGGDGVFVKEEETCEGY